MKKIFSKKIILSIVFVCVVVMLVFPPTIVSAFGPSMALIPAAVKNFVAGEVFNQIIAASETLFYKMLALAGAFSLQLASYILWLGGTLLTEVLTYTVVNMTENITSGAIDVAWRVFRDVANMFFIFIILYIAIGTILRLSSVNTKKMLVSVVVVALLLNFSLFFTKVIIDASNLLTIGFYNRITAGAEGTGISDAFTEKMGLTSMFENVVTLSGIDSENDQLLRIAIAGFMGTILFIVAAFIFAAASIMFIGRFVILIFLMILSPLAFVAMALPKDKYSSRWWNALFNQCIFAPAYIALVYVSLKILEGVVPINGNAENLFNGSQTVGPTGAKFIMDFVIIIIMMVACLIMAKEFGAYGAGTALNTLKNRSNKVRQWTQGKIGRGTVGFVGAKMDKGFGNTHLGNSRFGRQLRSITTGAAANAEFGSGISRKKVLETEKALTKEIAGKARTIDNKQILKAGAAPGSDQEAKLRQTINRMSTKEIDELSASDIAKNISHFSPQQIEHILEKSEAFTSAEKDKMRDARFKPISDAINTLKDEDAKRDAFGLIYDEDERNRKKAEYDAAAKSAKGIIKNLSNKEIELGEHEGKALIANETFVINMKKGQADALTKTDNNRTTPAQKQAIKDMRKKPLQDHVTAGQTDPARFEKAKKIMLEMDNEERADLDTEILTHIKFLSMYDNSMLRKMRDKLSYEKQRAIKDKLLDIGELVRIEEEGRHLSPQQLEKLAPLSRSDKARIKKTYEFLVGQGQGQF